MLDYLQSIHRQENVRMHENRMVQLQLLGLLSKLIDPSVEPEVIGDFLFFEEENMK